MSVALGSRNNISYRLYGLRIRRSVNEPLQPPFCKWNHILSMTRRGGGCGRIIQTAPIDQVALQYRGYCINLVKYREQHDNYVALAGDFS